MATQPILMQLMNTAHHTVKLKRFGKITENSRRHIRTGQRLRRLPGRLRREAAAITTGHQMVGIDVEFFGGHEKYTSPASGQSRAPK